MSTSQASVNPRPLVCFSARARRRFPSRRSITISLGRQPDTRGDQDISRDPQRKPIGLVAKILNEGTQFPLWNRFTWSFPLLFFGSDPLLLRLRFGFFCLLSLFD